MIRQKAATEKCVATLARHGVHHVLVAGDVYDSDAPNPLTQRAPIERMKPFADLHWHLLPGNHGPHRPEGVWDSQFAFTMAAPVIDETPIAP